MQFARLSSMTMGERIQMCDELSAMTKCLSRQAIRETMPNAPESAVILRWIELVYNKELAVRVAPFADRLGVESKRQ